MAKAEPENTVPAGFAEAPAAFIHAAPAVAGGQKPGLWGALRGSVSIAPGYDLTAATGESWSAET